VAELPEPLRGRLRERRRRQARVAQHDRLGQGVGEPRPAEHLGAGQEAPRRVVRHGAQDVGAHDVSEQRARRAVGEVLADRFEDVAALNAVDDYWPAAEKSERVRDPIGDRRVRVDVISVYDVDIICQGDTKEFGRDRAQQVPVRHPAVSAHFLNVVDLDTGAGVVLRICGHPAVSYLMLLGSRERGERRVIP
jgi:hypothetical protein